MATVDELAAFLDELRRRLVSQGRGERPNAGVVIATVVRSRGSTPRKVGAKMLIDPSGGFLGTIGGGCGEAEVVSRAHRVLGTGEPQVVEVSLLEEDGFESSSICGGLLDVFLERAGETVGGIPRDRLFAALDERRDQGIRTVIATLIATGPGDAARGLVGRKTMIDERGEQLFPFGDAELDGMARACVRETEASAGPREVAEEGIREVRLFLEPVCEPPEIVVVGAGHVGAAVARLAVGAGFLVTVIDDRSSFANPVRLAGIQRILVGPPRETLALLPPRADRHVVLVTRGHRLDAECLEEALGMSAAYIGMIGSRRRVRRIREWLALRGATEESLARVHAPIGLDIGAETPAEIAIAILAEIVASRRSARRQRG
jgi:xanthine dehydrogenase accessory factor